MTDLPPFCPVDPVSHFCDFRTTVDVLRLDLLHPVVSGNKWFKLKHYLAEAAVHQKTVVTFGGAFSNHVVATAAATSALRLKSVGIIRGEEPSIPSHTLQQAQHFGMDLYFVARADYAAKTLPASISAAYAVPSLYIVPEGGYGPAGARGAADILSTTDVSSYTHIIAAVGTGTTLAGLVLAAAPGQRVIGVSALKNNYELKRQINFLLPVDYHDRFLLLHDYAFGGYARRNETLVRFMNEFFAKTGIPTDFVYTAKAMFSVFDLVSAGFFSASDKILFIHTGGLQGNNSLPKGTLIFG